jgi:hypothetical protein
LKALLIFVAVAASLPMAWISLSKMALITGAIWTRWVNYKKQPSSHTRIHLQNISPLNKVIYFSIVWMLISIAWTSVDIETAIYAFVKHAKILIIPLILYIATDKKIGSKCLNYALFSQIGICFISWCLYIKYLIHQYLTGSIVNLNINGQNFSVFSESQLDQSIMFVVSAGIIWHIRNSIPCIKEVNPRYNPTIWSNGVPILYTKNEPTVPIINVIRLTSAEKHILYFTFFKERNFEKNLKCTFLLVLALCELVFSLFST